LIAGLQPPIPDSTLREKLGERLAEQRACYDEHKDDPL
jgi:hypothetical protein